MAPPSRTRGWWRDFFVDHPGVASRSPDGLLGDKHKVWCEKCFSARVAAEVARDEGEVTAGLRASIRDQQTIQSTLWAASPKDPGRGWLASATKTLINHLKACSRQPQAIKQMAEAYLTQKSISPYQRTHRESVSGISTVFPHPQTGHPQANTIPTPSTSMPDHQAIPSSQNANTLFALGPLTLYSPILSESAVPSPISLNTPSELPSLIPSPILSEVALSDFSRREQVTRSSSRVMSHQSSVVSDTPGPWSSSHQRRFETRVARLTASANFPPSWIENPEWLAFLDEFLPSAISPTRKALTTRIIPAEVQKIRQAAMKQTEGCDVTLQCNRWTGISDHHYVAFLMTTSKRELHTVWVHDASHESTTAENLLALIWDVKAMVEKDWKVKVIALTTDCSGESKKIRRVAVEQDPSLVGPDCYGHQINLVVGSYLACETIFMRISRETTELISWLHSKPFILALVRETQESLLNKAAVPVLRIFLPRWTAHFLAYRRLLELRQTLEIIATQEENRPDDKKLIIKGKPEVKEHAQKMMKLVQNPVFWFSIARVKNHLEPLAVATNMAQSAHCRLDQVLLMFGLLVKKYTELKLQEPEDAAACNAILNSLELRWSNADQDVFIAAVLLNPMHKTAPFVKSPNFTVAAIYSLFSRLWTRFYSESMPTEIVLELRHYLEGSGQYEDLKVWISALQHKAMQEGYPVDPIKCYDGLSIPGQPRTPLQTLACRILTICANSASVERLFSLFGQILTKLRSRLQNEAMAVLAELKLYIRDEYRQSGAVKTQLRHHIAGVPRSGHSQPKTESPLAVCVSTLAPPPPTSSLSQQQSQPGPGKQADDASTSSAGPAEGSLNDIVGCLLKLIDEEENTEPHLNQWHAASESSIKLSELFDFTAEHWMRTTESAGSRGVQDELEFYELLDLDGSGEQDTDIMVDSMSEAVLMSN